MANGDPTNNAQGNWQQLLQRLGPFLMQMGQQQRPQGGAPPVPGMAPPMPPPPTLGQPPQSGLDIKADPRASSFLPPPAAQAPQRQAQEYQPYQGRYPLTPKNQGAYDMVQGFTGFITKWAQKKDQEKSAEASNAAQALMQALESGDMMSADHIFHENEQLFNKVYKGWLQKAEKAQEPQKKEKPDPTVQGVESGMQQYLHGKKSNYMIPRSTPTQQATQQAASSQAQALKQQPSLAVPGATLSPEEQLKYSTALVKYQTDLQADASKLQEANVNLQRAQAEQSKAFAEAQAAQAKGETSEKLDQGKILQLNILKDIATQRFLNTQALGANIKARGKLTGQISNGYKIKFAALDQVDQYLASMKADKRDFTTADVAELQQHLKVAGATNLGQSLNKYLNSSKYMPDMFTKPSVDQLMERIKSYRNDLDVIRKTSVTSASGLPIGEEDTDQGDEDVITITPEDMK